MTRALSCKVMLSIILFLVFGTLALTEAGDDETMAMVGEVIALCWFVFTVVVAVVVVFS